MSAVFNTKMPTISDKYVIDYKKQTKKGLPLSDFPIAITVLKIGDKLIVDPLIEEREALDARLTITTMEDGTVCAMQKGGEGQLSIEEIGEMLDIAQRKAKELRSKVKK